MWPFRHTSASRWPVAHGTSAPHNFSECSPSIARTCTTNSYFSGIRSRIVHTAKHPIWANGTTECMGVSETSDAPRSSFQHSWCRRRHKTYRSLTLHDVIAMRVPRMIHRIVARKRTTRCIGGCTAFSRIPTPRHSALLTG